MRTPLRTRVVAGLTATAAIGAALLAMTATDAKAADVGSIAGAVAPTVIVAGTNDAPAGDWILAALPSVAVGDKITVRLDDADVAANCAANDDSVGFSAVPTVSNITAENSAAFTVSINKSSPLCSAPAANVNDVLIIQATAADGVGGTNAVVKISGIKLNAGKSAASGPVRYVVNPPADTPHEALLFTSEHANAVITAVKAGSATPGQLIPKPTQDTPIGNITFTESRPGVITTACVSLLGTIGSFDQSAPKPQVSATAGTGAGVPTGPSVTISPDGRSISFAVTPSTSIATTYTISGIRLDTTLNGPVNARAKATCDPNVFDDFGIPIRLAFVGAAGRIAGADRFDTARLIAGLVNPDNTAVFGCLAGRTVVIARGDNFPDALASSFLAGSNNVPILLTNPTSVPQATLDALRNGGATDVIVIGGEQAISTAVDTQLTNTPVYDCVSKNAFAGKTLKVTRANGADRYATAARIAKSNGTAGTVDFNADGKDCAGNATRTAIVASGENFPDALAAGPLAARGLNNVGGVCGSGPLPMMLTKAASLPADTASALSELGIRQVILMGGTSAVSDAVATAISNMSIKVIRIAGADRQATAVDLANKILGPDAIGNFNLGGFFVARPDQFPDALVAAPLAGKRLAPIFLAQSTQALGATTANGIIGYPSTVFLVQGVLLGGTAALDDNVLLQTSQAIATQPG